MCREIIDYTTQVVCFRKKMQSVAIYAWSVKASCFFQLEAYADKVINRILKAANCKIVIAPSFTFNFIEYSLSSV